MKKLPTRFAVSREGVIIDTHTGSHAHFLPVGKEYDTYVRCFYDPSCNVAGSRECHSYDAQYDAAIAVAKQFPDVKWIFHLKPHELGRNEYLDAKHPRFEGRQVEI